MTGWIIIGVIVLLIAGLMSIPIGVDVGYEGGQFRASAKVCGILLQLFPKKPTEGEPKPKKEKKPKPIKKKKNPPGEAAAPKKKRKLSFSKDEILSLLRKVLKSFGRFGRAFRVDRFLLDYTAAGEDPYNTAMTYAYVNTALSSLAPLCVKRFKVKDCRVHTDVDFTADKMKLDFSLAISLRIGKIFSLVFSIGFAAVGMLLRNKLRLAKEKRANKKNGTADADQIIEIETVQENIQEEERMDANG